MSCPEFSFAPRGRQGIGVIQPQSGLDYPLVSPSEDIRYLLADMYFEYDDDGLYDPAKTKAELPLRIKWLYGVGCEENDAVDGAPEPMHDADIVIVDANDVVVFDSTQLGNDQTYQRFSVKNWGSDYKLYEWLSNTAVCRLVVYTNWSPDENSPRNYKKNLAPVAAVIDERAVYRMPKRVRHINVLTTETTRKRVVFQAGYNMRLTNADTEVIGLRNQTAVTFDCSPGYGFGQYSDCTEDKPKYIYTVNGGAPNKYGDFFLSGGECIYARIPTQDAGNGKVRPVLVNGNMGLRVGSDCPACCDCPDYVNTATYMNFVRDEYGRVGQRAHGVKLLHEENIDRWVSQRNCRVSKPLRVSLSPLSCPYMEVIVQFCNQCATCVENIILNANFSTSPNGASAVIVPGYTLINGAGLPNEPFNITGGWPNFSAPIGFVDKGASVFVRFLLKFSPNTVPFAVTSTLTGTISGEPIKPCDPNTPGANTPAQSTDTRALYCNEAGCTDIFNNVINTININSASAINKIDGSRIYTVNASTTNSTPVQYRWQRSLNGADWLNMVDVALSVSGSQTGTLTLQSNYLTQYPGQTYRLLLQAENTTSRTFTPPTPTQEQGTISVSQSGTQSLPNGDKSYTIAAAANNLATINYQWQYTDDNTVWINLVDSGTEIVGATTNTLVLSAAYLTQHPNRKYRASLTANNTTTTTYNMTPTLAGKTIWSRGVNMSGQLGQGNTTFYPNPVTVGSNNNWVAVSAGAHALAINTDGEIYGWGTNSNGQLGTGLTSNFISTPTRIGLQSNWVFVSAGIVHSLAINANGELWGWGGNFSGQLGDNTTVAKYTPIRIGTANNWVYANAGTMVSFAINANGELWAWGKDTKGLLGLGGITQQLTPAKINTSVVWSKVSSVSNTAIGLTADGDAYVWGDNTFGSLGLNLPTTQFKHTPTLLSHIVGGSALKWKDVSMSEHGLAISIDGRLYSWGKNNMNQLGLNDPVPSTVPYYSTPQQIGTAQNWKYAYASMEYSLALTDNNTAYGFGSNAYSAIGPAGTGTGSRQPVPYAMVAGSNFDLLAPGGTFSIGLLS